MGNNATKVAIIAARTTTVEHNTSTLTFDMSEVPLCYQNAAWNYVATAITPFGGQLSYLDAKCRCVTEVPVTVAADVIFDSNCQFEIPRTEHYPAYKLVVVIYVD
jgi:hypothetical protein